MASCLVVVGILGAGSAMASDFATQVLSYTQGTGVPMDPVSGLPFNDPNSALGAPTIDSTGDGFDIPSWEAVPLVPVYGALRTFEVVTVGNSGQLTLAFDHPVVDNPANPYGVDFIVFGNSFQTVQGGGKWWNGDPTGTCLGSGFNAEPGRVSVAQDPNGPWYTFSPGPYADTFAPTIGRSYVEDPNDADPNVGVWNEWWGAPMDPTKPLDPNDPNYSAAGFSGMSVAQVAQAYAGSAGGTGFDLSAVGLSWIQYVRIEDVDPNIFATTEIDAVADVAAVYSLEVTISNEAHGYVEIDPIPEDANNPAFKEGTEVTLTAVTIEDATFKWWLIFDPNYPDDGNLAAQDSNSTLTLLMDMDYHVHAVFQCGTGTEPLPPLLALIGVACGLARRRR
ncbi:MAG: hypothetical protein JXQ73_03045 [Phycisphaerae bacterium]|nr:hypothetical protein [Phycisphaerae bacterium]